MLHSDMIVGITVLKGPYNVLLNLILFCYEFCGSDTHRGIHKEVFCVCACVCVLVRVRGFHESHPAEQGGCGELSLTDRQSSAVL